MVHSDSLSVLAMPFGSFKKLSEIASGYPHFSPHLSPDYTHFAFGWVERQLPTPTWGPGGGGGHQLPDHVLLTPFLKEILKPIPYIRCTPLSKVPTTAVLQKP